MVLLALDRVADEVLKNEAGLADHGLQFGVGIGVAFGSDIEVRRHAIARKRIDNGISHKRSPGSGGPTIQATSRRHLLPPSLSARSTSFQSLSPRQGQRSEEHTSELQSLMRISYAVFGLKKNTQISTVNNT